MSLVMCEEFVRQYERALLASSMTLLVGDGEAPQTSSGVTASVETLETAPVPPPPAGVRRVQTCPLDVDERQSVEVRVGAIPLGVRTVGTQVVLDMLDDPTTDKMEFWIIFMVPQHQPSKDILHAHYLGQIRIGLMNWYYFYRQTTR
jgi:hypothetical protein